MTPSCMRFGPPHLEKELDGLAKDDNKMGAAGTNTIFVLDHEGIELIPAD